MPTSIEQNMVSWKRFLQSKQGQTKLFVFTQLDFFPLNQMRICIKYKFTGNFGFFRAVQVCGQPKKKCLPKSHQKFWFPWVVGSADGIHRRVLTDFWRFKNTEIIPWGFQTLCNQPPSIRNFGLKIQGIRLHPI